MTMTIGIITYFISFFVVETFALFIYGSMNLSVTFLITNLFWILYFLIFLSEKKNVNCKPGHIFFNAVLQQSLYKYDDN